MVEPKFRSAKPGDLLRQRVADMMDTCRGAGLISKKGVESLIVGSTMLEKSTVLHPDALSHDKARWQ